MTLLRRNQQSQSTEGVHHIYIHQKHSHHVYIYQIITNKRITIANNLTEQQIILYITNYIAKLSSEKQQQIYSCMPEIARSQ